MAPTKPETPKKDSVRKLFVSPFKNDKAKPITKEAAKEELKK